jgi:uncharacterized membrane protein YoaK (UPF0700 family)
MTGNVVFLGFAAAGASGLSVPGSLLALAFFLCGGMAAGRLAGRLGNDGRRGLRIAASVELALSTAAVAVAAFSGQNLGAGSRYALIALLTVAIGAQDATARRRLAVSAMLVGALLGALLLLHVSPVAPLVLAIALLALIVVAARPRRCWLVRGGQATSP